MRSDLARIAATGLVVAASIATASLGAFWSAAIRAPVAGTPEPALDFACAPAGDREETALDPGGASERGVRSPVVPVPPADAGASTAELSTMPGERERAASLAAAIEPSVFHAASFEVQARALAGALSPEAARDLARLAADRSLTAAERVAIAEILRHVPHADEIVLPASALIALRDAWRGRESDATLATAAVRALAAFGDTEDRRAMLDEISPQASSGSAALACAGLSAARGDEAALQVASAAVDDRNPRRFEIALSALTAIATGQDRGLSASARSQCAEALLRALADGNSSERSSARILSALAALDPGRAEAPLIAALADPSSSDASAQSAVSVLAQRSTAAPDLARLLADVRLPDRRRALVAETLLLSGSDSAPEARNLLERVRADGKGTAIGLRAARVLEGVDAKPGDELRRSRASRARASDRAEDRAR